MTIEEAKAKLETEEAATEVLWKEYQRLEAEADKCPPPHKIALNKWHESYSHAEALKRAIKLMEEINEQPA